MDYKFSFIVPCFKGKFDEVKRNFDSILDQDYKNWEIIFVPNGQWTGKKTLINKVKREYKMVKILELEKPDVCEARNKGAEIASGDIFSFLSSDLALHSGTVRTWQLEFSKKPECGFVYSGYRFFPNVETDVYNSEPFDPYKLECYNYIDGANPVRREVNVQFDPEIKSLNDWDWIIRIVQKGVQGHYVPEPLYSADLPKPGGLSWDSSHSWLERTEQIKRKNGIPIREVCCTSLLDESEALRIAKIINADYHGFPSQRPNRYKVVYCYGFGASNEYLQAQAMSLGGHVTSAHKIIHWIGLDLRVLADRKWGEVDALTMGVFGKIKHHWVIGQADEQLLTKILKGSGVKPRRVFPPIEQPRRGQLEDYVYINDLALLEQIQKAMPDIELTNCRKEDCEVHRGIPKISVHFQDRPANMIRAAAEGSFIITESLMPYMGKLEFKNIPDIRRQIVHTIRQINNDGMEKDKKAMRYYRQSDYFKRKIDKIREVSVRRLGKLEDILDVMPSQEQLKS